MFRLIYRQRRRLLFGAFFFTIAIAMRVHESYLGAYQAAPFDITPTHWIAIAKVAGGAFAVIFGSAIALILVLPRWRVLVDQVALLVFLNYSLGLKELPAKWFGFGEASEWLVLFALMVMIQGLTYGMWLDRFRVRFAMFSTRRARFDLTPEELWPMIALKGGEPARHWEPILHDVVADADDPNTLIVRYNLGPAVFLEQIQVVTASEPPVRYAYRFSGPAGGRNRALTTGTWEARIEPDGQGGSLVTTVSRFDSLLPRTALLLWFDDIDGDFLDGGRARFSGRRDWSISGLVQRKILELS